MTIEARKIMLVQELLRIDNELVIEDVERLLRKSRVESVERETIPMTVELFNKEIDKALEDEKQGNLIRAEDLKTKIKQWS